MEQFSKASWRKVRNEAIFNNPPFAPTTAVFANKLIENKIVIAKQAR
jgi:hypothetical protein